MLGQIGEEEEGARGEWQVRGQPWMRHGSHQMTTLVLAHKDDDAILQQSALCARSALVNKLYCTDVSCEWVSCLHLCRCLFNWLHQLRKVMRQER